MYFVGGDQNAVLRFAGAARVPRPGLTAARRAYSAQEELVALVFALRQLELNAVLAFIRLVGPIGLAIVPDDAGAGKTCDQHPAAGRKRCDLQQAQPLLLGGFLCPVRGLLGGLLGRLRIGRIPRL